MIRPTKDIDVFCKPGDAPRLLARFKAEGYRVSVEDDRWIAKVWSGEHFFDVIFNMSSASGPITDAWFTEVYTAEVYGTQVRLTPPTEFIVSNVEGEPLEIYPFLGSSRLAEAVDRFENVKAVVHGHAHRGTYSGHTTGGVPVYNCAQFVVSEVFGRPYALLDV